MHFEFGLDANLDGQVRLLFGNSANAARALAATEASYYQH